MLGRADINWAAAVRASLLFILLLGKLLAAGHGEILVSAFRVRVGLVFVGGVVIGELTQCSQTRGFGACWLLVLVVLVVAVVLVLQVRLRGQRDIVKRIRRGGFLGFGLLLLLGSSFGLGGR